MRGGASRFRAAVVADLADIEALDRACFDKPWPMAIYREELRRENSLVELARDEGGTLVGLSCAWIVVDECHLLRIATDPKQRRQGIARALLHRVLTRARARSCQVVDLEVASRNRGAMRLYERAGFAVVGRRPGYYADPPDDAVLMTLEL